MTYLVRKRATLIHSYTYLFGSESLGGGGSRVASVGGDGVAPLASRAVGAVEVVPLVGHVGG